MKTTTIFVYGTLRENASNHWRMKNSQHLGKATVPGRLYRIDWYPGLILDPSATPVMGDVYLVSDDILAELDHFEGTIEYQRVITEVHLDHTPIQAHLWEYILPTDQHPQITSGDWLAK